MKSFARATQAAGWMSAGMVLGVFAAVPFGPVTAQEAPADAATVTVDVTEANAEKIRQASDAIRTAQAALVQDGAYVPAIGGLNAYAVLSGGVDAVADLEAGRGVDPITFAGLHAGLATDDIVPNLAFDANGRLTYKGKLVRMYPPERMRHMTERQTAVLTAAAGGRRVGVGDGSE